MSKLKMMVIGIILCILLCSQTDMSNVTTSAENYLETEIRNLTSAGTAIIETEENSSDSSFVKGTITRVKDGDTVVVNIDGEDYVVRMIGINTPESVHADDTQNTPEGDIASDYTKSLLPEGTVVFLEYDEDMYDPYDRVLAYLWFTDNVNTTDFSDFREYNIGAIIMQNTYCEAVYYEPNGKYKEWYEQLDN